MHLMREVLIFKNDLELPRTVILASHFYWFGRYFLSTGILTLTALMVQWQNSCNWWRGPEFRSRGWSLFFFMMTPLEPRFKSGFHNPFRDLVVHGKISWMPLEIYKWNLGTKLANYFLGIHKFQIICSMAEYYLSDCSALYLKIL
jgi:hypothetical protein